MKQWFINQSLAHPIRSIVLTVLITALMGSGIRFFVIDDDVLKMLPDDIPVTETWHAVQDEFGSTNVLFIAFGHTGSSVYTPENFAKAWDLTRAIEDLPMIDEVMSVSSLNRMDSDDGFMEVDDLQPQRDLTPEQIADIRTYLEKTPDMKVRVVSRYDDYLNLLVRAYPDSPNDVLATQVVAVADSVLQGYDIHYGGQTYMTGTIPKLLMGDVMMLMRVGLIIMILILLASFRNIPALMMVLATILLSMAFMLGFVGWMFHLTGSDKFLFTMVNASMPIILLTIANSYGVHVVTKFFRYLRKTGDVRMSIENAMNSLILPIFLAGLTTVLAFSTMIFAPLESLAGYGFGISAGVLWAWILSSVFLPSLLGLKKWNLQSRAVSRESMLERLISRLGHVVLHYPRRVLILSLGLVLISAVGFLWLKVEVSLTSFFNKGTEIRESIDFLDEQMTGYMDLQLRVEGDMRDPVILRRMEEIQNYLETHFAQVSTTVSLADVIRLMHRTVMDDDPQYEVIPDTREKVNNLLTLYSMSGDPDDFSSMVDYDYRTGLISAFMRSISTSEIVAAVDEIQDFIAVDQPADMDITISGMLMILAELVRLILHSSFISIFASILIIAIVTGLFFKRAIWGFFAIIPLVSAVIMNYGFMGIFNIHLSHVTALLSAIIIGVGVDFAVHYISQFRNLLARNPDDPEISQHTINEVGFPIVLDAASNMAFGALIFSAIVPIKHMGGLMIFAMLATSIGTLTLLAAVIELYRNKLIRRDSK